MKWVCAYCQNPHPDYQIEAWSQNHDQCVIAAISTKGKVIGEISGSFLNDFIHYWAARSQALRSYPFPTRSSTANTSYFTLE
jgi:hypothetical protein